ncbi:MAG: hypothetical protein GYB67_06620 [Chloroflexi bacterium]|nr:hypothetical protein [Chloroflexota bacterium]
MKRLVLLILVLALALGAAFAQDDDNETLIIGINAEAGTLDPHFAAGAIIHNRVFGMIFDTLVSSDRLGNLEPMLATSWENTDDTTWVFQLRPDVQFHNGAVMTAEDVAFSFNRLLFDERESLARPGYLPFISSVEATGDLEVTITTPTVDPLLPIRISGVVVMPQAYVEATDFEVLQTEPIGAGPYRVVEWVLGERLVLERHDDYWMGLADAEAVILRFIPEGSTRVAALQTGEVDFITTVGPDQIELVEAEDGVRVDVGSVLNYMNIWFNTNEGFITADPRIRQALSLAIDRAAIAEALWDGRVRVMNDYFLPTEFGYAEDRPDFAYDPERAQELLEAAGYAGEPIAFTPPNVYYTNARLVTDVINEMWRAIGVNTDYEPLDTPAWAERSLAGNNVVTLQSFGSSGDPATNGAIANWLAGGWPALYYQPGEEFVALAEEAAASLDPELRRENYRRIAEILDEEVPFAPLYQSVEFYGVRDGIEWTPRPDFAIDLRPGVFELD